jgi:hypothetical protein
MGSPLSGAAAGAGEAITELLREMFLRQSQRQAQAMQGERDKVGAELGRGNLEVSRGNLDLRGKEFDASMQPKPQTPHGPMAVSGRIVDPNTGRVIYEPPAAPEKPPTPVMRIGRSGKMEQIGDAPAGAHFVNEPAPSTVNLTTDNANKNLAMKLADDYTRDAKDYTTMNSAMRRVVASANQPSAAGDMALLYSYMKILDPNSVVRETEFAQAAQSGSLPQQIQGAATKVLNGQRLTPEQRTDFVNRARALYGEADKSNKSIRESYTQRARKFGVDPSLIFTDIGAPEPTTGGGVGRVYYDANGNPIKK